MRPTATVMTAVCVVISTVAAACTVGSDGAGSATTTSMVASTTGPTSTDVTTTTSPTTVATTEVPTTVDAPTTTTTATTTTTTVPAVLECAFADGDNARQHAGLDRNVLFASANTTEPAPVLMLFHGFASVPADFAANSGLLSEAADAGVALAVPFGSGFPITWEQGVGPNDDAGFVTTVFDDLADDPCIDPNNIWLAGYSAGAGFVGLFACSVADRIAGIAMNAAVAPPLCNDLDGFDVIVSHGTADIVVPYDGLPIGGITLPPSPELAAAWATNLGCTNDAVASAPDFEQERWTECGDDGNTVDMLTYLGGGHRWPGRPDVGGEGVVIDAPDLTCTILAAINGAADPANDCLA